MRIVFILSGTVSSGGATKSFLNLHNFLKSTGDETLVVTPDKNGIYNVLKSAGIRVIDLRYGFNTISTSKNPILVLKSYLSFLRNKYYSYLASKKLINTCKKFQPDLIHSNTSVNNIGYLTAKKLEIPHIWHVREYGDLDFGFKVPFLKRKINSLNNYSICITKEIAKHTKCFQQKNSRVIYNGVLSEFEYNHKHKKNYFLYAGRIEKAKGLIDLIKAYNIYNKRKSGNCFPLKIAGKISDLDYYNTIIQTINKYSLTNIEFLGEIIDIKTLLEEAKAVVVPSYSEGFGRVTTEAMACGTLVIGRNTAGTKEQFDNGLELTGEEIGIRFNCIEDLASNILKVAESNYEIYQSMVQRAQKCVMELYSCNKYGTEVRNFYKYILEDR